jgi:hypothetical protein
MTLYNLVKTILERDKRSRDDDRHLIWMVCCKKTLVMINNDQPRISKLMYMDFMNAPSFESITRARREVQKDCIDLRGEKYYQRHERAKKTRSQYAQNIFEELVPVDLSFMDVRK